jgi:hypothetical protein
MAARTIVTSHPDVACDVCGRRLLRGEQPDIFLGSGQRRLVCELCTSRATHEGWRRETEERASRPRSEHPQRGRSLLGGLRQLRWPTRSAAGGGGDRPIEGRRAQTGEAGSTTDVEAAGRPAAQGETPVAAGWTDIGAEWTSVEEEWTGAQESWEGVETVLGEAPAAIEGTALEPTGGGLAGVNVRRALEVFNAGEHPRRVAGVARALGAPSVRAAPFTSTKVAIVVAWELCWYRYEIDLGEELHDARLTAEGMELGELPGEDRVANAVADERGELSLV